MRRHLRWQNATRASFAAAAAGVWFIAVGEFVWAWAAFAVGIALSLLAGLLVSRERRENDASDNDRR